MLDELCVDGLSIVVVLMFAYDGFSGVSLDAAIEYGIHKLLFRLEQQDGLGCTWHESAAENITDVMCARLRENRAIPVVEMLVVLEDRIDTTVTANPLLEVIETVGVRSCSCATTRRRSLSNWAVPNSAGRGSKTVELLLSELVLLGSCETFLSREAGNQSYPGLEEPDTVALTNRYRDRNRSGVVVSRSRTVGQVFNFSKVETNEVKNIWDSYLEQSKAER